MPIYTFKSKSTQEIVTLKMSISEYESFVNPDLERYFDSAPPLGDPVRLGITRPNGAFNEVLSRIHSRNPYSNLNQKLSRNP